MSAHRIQRLLEARNLEEVRADDAEVAAIWAAALREWSDASVAGLSVAGAYTHVYQAAFRAATAVVRSAGYRPRGAVGGHHYVTFYALGAGRCRAAAKRRRHAEHPGRAPHRAVRRRGGARRRRPDRRAPQRHGAAGRGP